MMNPDTDGSEAGGYWDTPISNSNLREWWHNLLRRRGAYPTYAFFLVLPSDQEMVKYLIQFGKELDIVSGENCLVIALGNTEFRRSGFDKNLREVEEVWQWVLNDHVSLGYSSKVAKLFDIGFDKFPCLIIFKDIRSSEHHLVTLKEMTSVEIGTRVRFVFSIIHKAVANKNDPLTALQAKRNSEDLQKKGQSIVSGLRSFAGKTFETAVETWIKASIK